MVWHNFKCCYFRFVEEYEHVFAGWTELAGSLLYARLSKERVPLTKMVSVSSHILELTNVVLALIYFSVLKC